MLIGMWDGTTTGRNDGAGAGAERNCLKRLHQPRPLIIPTATMASWGQISEGSARSWIVTVIVQSLVSIVDIRSVQHSFRTCSRSRWPNHLMPVSGPIFQA